MRHPARHLVLAACLAVTGLVAHAAPGRHGGRHGKLNKHAKHRSRVAPPSDRLTASDEDRSGDDAEVEARATARLGGRAAARKRARAERARAEAERDTERVAFASRDAGGERIDVEDDMVDDADATDGDRAEVVDAPVKLRRHTAAHAKDWHVAIGPYLWASSVDANVSLGPASVSAGVDFIQMERHARYGAEVLAEARYGRISLSGDLMYGVVAVDGQTAVGPLMVTLNGTASSVLVDGAAGYMLAGGDHSLLSLEARGGVRYQRTAVAASVGVAGADVSPPEQVDAGADAVGGARVFVRPSSRFYFSGTFDLGVFGASNSTWSASADASVRVTSRFLLSLGWRTLTIDRANVAITMRGPRAAVQLLF